MKFHLDHTPEKFTFEISHAEGLFLIGSCFAENIAQKTQAHAFTVLSNPNGILFNPQSILQSLEAIIEQRAFDEKHVLERDGLFYSFLHHSSIHAENKKDLLEKISAGQKEAHDFLKSSKYLIITFGSAFVYEHKNLKQVVSNCHKQSASVFEKRFLEPEETVVAYENLIKKLKIFNPGLQIIFTVSPVKYLKDGLENNSLSKASLLLSVQRLVKGNTHCHYFPAFELQNDDLRDYRFYKEDLAHPNAQAIDYIWEKFSETTFSEKTRAINQEIAKLNAAQNHRQLSASSEGEKKLRDFIESQKLKIRALAPEIHI